MTQLSLSVRNAEPLFSLSFFRVLAYAYCASQGTAGYPSLRNSTSSTSASTVPTPESWWNRSQTRAIRRTGLVRSPLSPMTSGGPRMDPDGTESPHHSRSTLSSSRVGRQLLAGFLKQRSPPSVSTIRLSLFDCVHGADRSPFFSQKLRYPTPCSPRCRLHPQLHLLPRLHPRYYPHYRRP